MLKKQNLRQCVVVIGLILIGVIDGFIFGQMSGMIDALRGKITDVPLNDGDLSLIASTINLTCFIGSALVGTITEILGRRKAIAVTHIPLLISWFMLYYGKHKEVLLASRILVGFSYGGLLLLMLISVGEYTPPHLRAFYLNVISYIGSLFGMFLGHILSILMYWRNVALIGVIPTVISGIFPLFWQESPSWLASKGRFQECESAFKALHVSTKSSKKELELLLNMEKQKHDDSQRKNQNRFSYVRDVFRALKQKYFWNTFAVGFTANTYRVFGGRVLFGTLALTMLQEITGTSDILYFTFFVDGFALLGAIISCILLKRLKMRPLLFTLGVLSNSLLLLLAIFIYFWPENNNSIAWIKVSLLALYFITVTAGPYPVLETLMTEIFPLEIKTFCILLQAILIGIIQFLSVKLAPSMFLKIGYHGVFFIHAIIIYICMLYLYFHLPETKSMTLQEIEITFRRKRCNTDTRDINETEALNDEKSIK